MAMELEEIMWEFKEKVESYDEQRDLPIYCTMEDEDFEETFEEE